MDYSKIFITSDNKFLQKISHSIDQDEYNETIKNIEIIVKGIIDYIDGYVNHINQTKILNERIYKKKYLFSTLKYFHKELGI